MTTRHEEIQKRRIFGIISHPDAGKTTLTEKLLLQILFLMVSKEAIFNTMEITISLHTLYSGFRKPLVFFSTSLRVTII